MALMALSSAATGQIPIRAVPASLVRSTLPALFRLSRKSQDAKDDQSYLIRRFPVTASTNFSDLSVRSVAGEISLRQGNAKVMG
jgi:hypothetical protein